MLIRILFMSLLLAGCATTGTELTPAEKAKLDPALQRLLTGATTNRAEYDVTTGKSGEETYGVLVRTDNADELKSAGFNVTSTFGDVAVVRATIPAIRSLLRLPSVRNVSNGTRSYPQ